MSQMRRTLSDIWEPDSDWQLFDIDNLEANGLDHRTKIYWNSKERLIAWVIARSEPTNPNFEGNFPISARTLRFCTIVQRDGDVARSYIATIEKWSSTSTLDYDTAMQVRRRLARAEALVGVDGGRYWWVDQHLEVARIHRRNRSGLRDVPSFYGKFRNQLDEDDGDEW